MTAGLAGKIAKLIGSDRPKAIAIFVTTRAEAECAILHARSGADLPVWVYCAEAGEAPAGCDRFVSGTPLRDFVRELKGVWVALSIVAWTGGWRSVALKLIPFLLPPFRVLVFNEAGGFFASRSAALAVHLRRRTRDRVIASVRRLRDWTGGARLWTYSIAYRGGEKIIDAVRLARSLGYRGFQRVRDGLRLAYSLAYRGAERTADGFRLAYSLGYRGFQRLRDRLRLAYSLAYRGAERTADGFRMVYSLAYRGLERAADGFRLGWSLTYRGGQRLRDIFRLTHSAILQGVEKGNEALLTRLAILAEKRVPYRRHALKLMPRRGPLHLKPDRLVEEETLPVRDTVEICIPGRAWSHRKVMRIVTASRAEFIVFRRGHETGDPGPLIHMARETGAFAAARQLAHSAWRRPVIVRHPFRRLQAGEVSEVFAPFSSLLVIRRDLFIRLGCPRAFTCGAALGLLFWKASAAGLRSLALGHEGVVTDEPAMMLEDAELTWRVMHSRALSKLGPRQPHRFRGNVAWSPEHTREFRPGRKRVLVVSPYLPFPLSHGGAVRIYNLCREMSGEIDFILACFREAGETVDYEKLHEIFREVYVVDADEKFNDPQVPKQIAEYRNPAMADLIRTFCLERRVDLVQLEYTQLAEYRDETGSVPVLLVEHDITFTLHRQFAQHTRETGARREYERWRAFEREALQCCNAVWTMSDHDRSLAIGHGAARRTTGVVPNGVDLDRFRPEVKRRGGAKTVLFVGSFRHLPNLLAFEVLRETILPAVWRSFPDTVLHVIAGPNHERAVEQADKRSVLASDPRIRIEGFVEDVRPAYREADVVVIPLPLSAGTNIKLMEAMACARAVVSTPAGCAGMQLVEGRELLVAESWPEFAEAVAMLLRNEDLRLAIAAEARRTAERRFGWDAIALEALASYAALTGEPAEVLPTPSRERPPFRATSRR